MSNDDVFGDVLVESSEGSFDPNEKENFGSWRAAVSYCLAVLCLSVALVSIVFAGVIARTRRFTYNVYIVFLLLPDSLLNLVLGIRCIYDGMLNNNPSKFPPLALCVAEQIGIGFYISNVLLNAIVSRELYTLVNNSYHRKRTKPPTLQKILCQVAFCYGITTVFVVWRLLPVSWAEKTVRNEPYCTATPRANQTAVAVVYALLLGPPTLYVLWTYDRMTRGKLLPRNGRTRALALYFMRMIGMFLFFYTPMTIVATVYYRFDEDRWGSSAYFGLLSVFTLLNPTQGAVNLVLFWQKDDIKLTCFHYASRIYTRLSSAAKPGSEGTPDSVAGFKMKIKRNSVWRQHDTYEREDGKLAVVTYLNAAGESIQTEYDDSDDDDSLGGMGMRMWMSAPFTLREVSAATEATEKAPSADARASRPSAVPTARSNTMSMLNKGSNHSVSEHNNNSTNVTSFLSKGSNPSASETNNSTNVLNFLSKGSNPSASENNNSTNVLSFLSKGNNPSASETNNSTNVTSFLSKGNMFPVSENSTDVNVSSSKTDAPPATNIAALRNLDYFNMALETV